MFKHFSQRVMRCLCVFLFSTGTLVAQSADTASLESIERADAAYSDQLHASEVKDLGAFVDGILSIHPELHAAKAALEEANARERQAGRPIYNPELEADYEDAVDKTYEIGLSQTVDWGGKRDAAYAVSASERVAAEAMYLQKRNEIAARILQELSDFWVAQTVVQLNTTSKSLMNDFARQSGMRYEAGDITRVEYETAQLAFAESRMRLAEADADMTSLANNLIAFGAPVSPISWPSMPRTLPDHLLRAEEVNEIIELLPEVRAAKAGVQGATASVDVAKAQKRPDPTFGIRAGEEDNESLIGINFSIPLFVRNNFDDDVMAALSAKSRVEAESETIIRLARADLTMSLLRFSTMSAAWRDWEEVSSVSLDTQTKVLTRLWEARELSMSEFLMQFRQTLDTQRTAAELRQKLWQSWIDFVRRSNQTEHWLETARVAQSAEELRGMNNEY